MFFKEISLLLLGVKSLITQMVVVTLGVYVSLKRTSWLVHIQSVDKPVHVTQKVESATGKKNQLVLSNW